MFPSMFPFMFHF